jgi:hypothetical protein
MVPGLRSSRIHILDTKPAPLAPKVVKVIEAKEIAERAGYSRPHTFHCGPDAIYVSAMGGANGGGPGGIFLLDQESFLVGILHRGQVHGLIESAALRLRRRVRHRCPRQCGRARQGDRETWPSAPHVGPAGGVICRRSTSVRSTN